MAIDFTKTFGSKNTKGNVQGSNTDKPKATFWLNIGYESDIPEEDGSGNRFVSLPLGIPLDTQERLPTNSRNHDFQAFQAARNDLLAQIMEVAQTLDPGESHVLNLQIQLRRVGEAAEEPSIEGNPFVKRLKLVG